VFVSCVAILHEISSTIIVYFQTSKLKTEACLEALREAGGKIIIFQAIVDRLECYPLEI